MGINFISIDQAAAASGYCVWEDSKPIKWGVIKPSPQSLRGGARLRSIRD